MIPRILLSTLSILVVTLLLVQCTSEATEHSSKDTDAAQSANTSFVSKPQARKALFGDLHVHTSWSFDAFIYNVRTTPDDAYAFGKGQAIDHFSLNKVQIDRPLDFMAVTDHSEYMGVMKMMLNTDHRLAKLPIAEAMRDEDRNASLAAFSTVGTSLARNEPIQELTEKEIQKSTWDRIIEIADRHYEPGKFTTFAGYEWTSSPSVRNAEIPYAYNLHRNLIYANTTNISDIPFSSFDSQDPQELWKWMDSERQKGIRLMAIPHNANMSDGFMYKVPNFEDPQRASEYAAQRMRNEPINEVVQIKGQSMSHPSIQTNDEYADFEIYPFTFANTVPPKSKAPGSYAREAFQKGLEMENTTGVNPFQFGIIGSSDGHNSGSNPAEKGYFGKLGNRDSSPEERLLTKGRFIVGKYMSAAGLAGVWSEENTREAIYAAMERKEVFATSGPRMQVRLFAINADAWDSERAKSFETNPYENGIPMGGEIKGCDVSPMFSYEVIKDPEGANIDKVHVIKAWLDDTGNAQEKIFNIKIDDRESTYPDGNLPSTVDVTTGNYENTVGIATVKGSWRDPEFNSAQNSMYFLRVLEIETPRWSTYDAIKLGIPVPDDLPATIQERAWSSPIWYKSK